MIASFLTPMLRLHPEKRARASELIHHVWLDGIQVQGEIDQIRAAEEIERSRNSSSNGKEKETAVGRTNSNKRNSLVPFAADEADALKPVEELETTAQLPSPPPTIPSVSDGPSRTMDQPQSKSKSTSRSARDTQLPQAPRGPQDQSAQRLVSIP